MFVNPLPKICQGIRRNAGQPICEHLARGLIRNVNAFGQHGGPLPQKIVEKTRDKSVEMWIDALNCTF